MVYLLFNYCTMFFLPFCTGIGLLNKRCYNRNELVEDSTLNCLKRFFFVWKSLKEEMYTSFIYLSEVSKWKQEL
jgi:hypothetical protein